MNVQQQSRLSACLFLLLALVAGAVPAHASVITLHFSGSADLPGEDGVLVPQTYSGSIAWETVAFAPADSNSALYALADLTFTFNDRAVPLSMGTFVSGELNLHDSYINICDSCAPGFDDVFVFSIKFDQG